MLGEGIAKQYGVPAGRDPDHPAQRHQLRRGGRPRAGRRSIPTLDNAAFVTQWAAKHVFGTNGEPNQLYIRAKPGTTQATANAIPTAISLGGPDQVSTQIPSDVLQARPRPTRPCRRWPCWPGLLALTVGGIGIANVMSISVIQRSAEIGIRRAVGHSRSKIGAQFLLESLFVGVLGGTARRRARGRRRLRRLGRSPGWVVVIDYGEIPIWMGLALLVSVVAGLYPSIKAARLEPLETLRLG